jgi:hypothetical protein
MCRIRKVPWGSYSLPKSVHSFVSIRNPKRHGKYTVIGFKWEINISAFQEVVKKVGILPFLKRSESVVDANQIVCISQILGIVPSVFSSFRDCLGQRELCHPKLDLSRS